MESRADREAFVLERDIMDLEGNRLLEAGCSLTARRLAELAARGRQGRWPSTSLVEFGSFRDDIGKEMGCGIYGGIFGDGRRRQTVRRMMEPVRFPLPVLQGISSFRESDYYTYRHILMVFALSCYLAREMLGRKREYFLDAAAGPLHDIGKVAVPAAVLKKERPLLRSERKMIEEHTLAGYVLLCHYLGDTAAFAARVARDHHERKDGSGYPRGIRLEDRLVEIVSACDIYDALVMPRPYRRKSYDNRTALEEITALAERGAMSWDVVRHLVALHRGAGADPGTCQVSLEKRGTPPEGNNYGVYVDDEAAGSA